MPLFQYLETHHGHPSQEVGNCAVPTAALDMVAGHGCVSPLWVQHKILQLDWPILGLQLQEFTQAVTTCAGATLHSKVHSCLVTFGAIPT